VLFRGLKIISEKVLKSKCYEISKANEKTVNTNYKTMTIDLITNSGAEKNYSDCKKNKSKTDLDDLNLNVVMLDEAKDDRPQINWKTTYSAHVALTVLTVNIVILLFCFIVLNTSKIQLDYVYTISKLIIFVEAIVYLVTSCVWNFMYSVEDMVNTPDDCDILEKVMDLSNRYKNNDVMVTIKVQQFRSRYAKYVYYNYNYSVMVSPISAAMLNVS